MGTVSTPSDRQPDALPRRRLKTFDEDDIVRYSMSLDVPIVGLVRNRGEYREMREIALIYGTTLGLGARSTSGARSTDGSAEREPKKRDEREVA